MKAIGHIYVTTITLYAFRCSSPEFIAGAIIGSVLPDSDHVKSWVGKLIPLKKWFKHRKQVHSIIFSLLFAFLSLLITRSNMISFGILFGCLNHLITDRMTSSVPYMFWFPFLTHKRINCKIKR